MQLDTFQPHLVSISPIQLICEPCSIIHQPGQGEDTPWICLSLPLYHEACAILQKFTAEASSLDPSIIVPWLPPIVESIYSDLQQPGHIELGRLLFFVSIIAWTTFRCSPQDEICVLFESHIEAHTLCRNWIATAFCLSDEVKKRGQPSLDCLQGQLILFKLSLHVEGLSRRNRALLAASVLLAREMGLHRLDTVENPASANLGTSADAEIARRLWWDVVSLDW